jgi:hypothetical protein
MSLKTENSRRVAKSRPVCMGLNSSKQKRGKLLIRDQRNKHKITENC